MDDFDPDQYLAESSSDNFDPDAYLNSKTAATPVSNGNAASSAVGSELRPYSSLRDMGSSLFGKSDSPVTSALEAVKGLLEFPARTGQMMNAGADAIANDTAESLGEHLGKRGVPAPVSAAIAMAAGYISNPLNYPMMGAEAPSGAILPPSSGVEAVGKDFAKYGITPTPAQLTQGQLAQRVETLGNRYPYSAQNFQNFYEKQMADADNIRSTLLKTVGQNKATETVSNLLKDKITNYLKDASPEDAAVLQDKFGDLDAYMQNTSAGQFGKGMLAQASKLARDKADQMYSSLPIDPQTPIATPQFSAQAKQFLNDELQASPVDRNGAWIKRLSSYANVQNVPGLDLGESVTGSEASKLQQAIQSALGERGAQTPFAGTQMTMKSLRDERIKNDPGYLLGASGQGNRFAGYAAKLRQALSSDIEQGVNAASPEAGQMLKDANKNYASYKQVFNDPYITGLLKNDPEDFMDHAIRPKDITNIGLLKNAVGKENFLPIKRNFLANMLVNKEGKFSPSTFLNNVKKFGVPTLSTIFDPDELAEITNAQRVSQAMGAAEKATGNTSGTAGIMMANRAILAAPSDALTTLVGGFFGHPAAGYLTGVAGNAFKNYVYPKLLAKAYLSEPVRDLILHGITAPDSAMSALGVLGKAAINDANERAGALPSVPSAPGTTGTQTQ